MPVFSPHLADALFILQRLERINGREGGRLATQPIAALFLLT